jgi:hypothetical protein
VIEQVALAVGITAALAAFATVVPHTRKLLGCLCCRSLWVEAWVRLHSGLSRFSLKARHCGRIGQLTRDHSVGRCRHSSWPSCFGVVLR